ncbi:response regulator [Marivita sp.]|jgi:CheY-like chemotaxis protein|uniref:response regulator n=1 Tax=Marivita sp. TaxID=2003365 RepID=UPI003F729089
MKILAVDDDPIILSLLKEVLGCIGLTNVRFCMSAAEAIQTIEDEDVKFDCFLLDIQMPAMDGIELTSIIRRMPQYARSPILMITAMSDRQYIDRAFAAGASDYVTKPFELGEVHARLKLIADLVNQRNQMEDRNPVASKGDMRSLVNQSILDERFPLVEIDGFIDYLALENYLLQVSRMSLFGTYAFGIVVPDWQRMFRSSSVYEYTSAVSDLAEAISDSLKPMQFLGSHAGRGEYVCVLLEGAQFDVQRFESDLNKTIAEMDLHFCDGRPLSLRAIVGDMLSLQTKSRRNIPISLVQALDLAEAAAKSPRPKKTKSLGPLKLLFDL